MLKIRGVFNRLYSCYGNLLCRENDYNFFTNDTIVITIVIITLSTVKK